MVGNGGMARTCTVYMNTVYTLDYIRVLYCVESSAFYTDNTYSVDINRSRIER